MGTHRLETAKNADLLSPAPGRPAPRLRRVLAQEQLEPWTLDLGLAVTTTAMSQTTTGVPVAAPLE